jgi:hypothetical protein
VLRRTGIAMRVSTSQSRGGPYIILGSLQMLLVT